MLSSSGEPEDVISVIKPVPCPLDRGTLTPRVFSCSSSLHLVPQNKPVPVFTHKPPSHAPQSPDIKLSKTWITNRSLSLAAWTSVELQSDSRQVSVVFLFPAKKHTVTQKPPLLSSFGETTVRSARLPLTVFQALSPRILRNAPTGGLCRVYISSQTQNAELTRQLCYARCNYSWFLVRFHKVSTASFWFARKLEIVSGL